MLDPTERTRLALPRLRLIGHLLSVAARHVQKKGVVHRADLQVDGGAVGAIRHDHRTSRQSPATSHQPAATSRQPQATSIASTHHQPPTTYHSLPTTHHARPQTRPLRTMGKSLSPMEVTRRSLRTDFRSRSDTAARIPHGMVAVGGAAELGALSCYSHLLQGVTAADKSVRQK